MYIHISFHLEGKKKRNVEYGPPIKEECGTVDDCFDNYQPCPRYGFAVKYTFKKGGQSYGPPPRIYKRNTEDGFQSTSPLDCKIVRQRGSPFGGVPLLGQVFG